MLGEVRLDPVDEGDRVVGIQSWNVATGEPESTKYAPSQPNPNVEIPFANGN